MSAGNRIAIIAVGLVAMILAFVALRPADEEEPTATATNAAQTATATTATAPATTTPATTTAAKPPAGPRTVTVAVKGGQPVGGVKEIEVERGDEIRIRVTADAPEEVHLHGYDVEKPVGPGQPAVFNIDANLEGIFEIELHGTATEIASLRVDPR